ncbi:MAG: fructose-6-phosphate aldolase [Candidatus Eremiobacterota bacterium]
MKIFLDSADIKEIREANTMGLIDGVTTNPTLLAKAVAEQGGKVNMKEYIEQLVKEVHGPISLETTGSDAETMVKQGKILAKFGENVVVKVPLFIEGLKAVKELKKEDIKCNVTLCFSVSQALLAAKAGAYFVSPFVGRLDDINQDGMQLIEEIVQIYANYDFKTEIIAASIRHPVHVLQSALVGAHIVTVPLSVIKKLSLHPKTDEGQKNFLSDASKVPEYLKLLEG